jgi:hypothetical protein
MKRIIVIGLLMISITAFSQNKCNLIDEYSKIFKQNRDTFKNKVFLYETVNSIDSTSTCGSFVNENKVFIQYLLDNYSSHSKRKEKLIKINDTLKLQKEFIVLLKRDTIFTQVMKKLSSVINTNQKKDTITLEKLLDISVKYFSIYKIKNDNYLGKVCGGINGIKQTEKDRFPFVEAFAFSTIFEHYRTEKFNMYNEFVKGIRELYKLELGIKNEEKLLRAQGAMYMFMRNNKTLKELLILEYRRKKRYLSFFLKE